MLTEKEIKRYSRHLLLPEIGMEGQEKLKNSRVLVIGAGGLGCPILLYLTAAGVGTIGIVDDDIVDETNLQRQILFNPEDVGHSKADVAKKKLQLQNPTVNLTSHPDGYRDSRLTSANALEIFSGYDIIVDGTDNFSTRYMVNDACVLLGKTLVSGSIFKFQGQVSVFNFRNKNGEWGPTYRCLFPSPPPPESAPSCSETGVLGVLPGVIGTLMANEVIKICTGIGEVLSGNILLFDALTMSFQTVEIKRNPEAIKLTPKSANDFKNMNYDFFCGIKNTSSLVQEISAEELVALIASKEKIQLLDVREKNEQPEVPELNDLKIPFGEIENHVEKISCGKKIIVICRSGARSKKAVELLTEKYNFQNIYTLKGGVTEWIKLFSKKTNV